MELSLTQPDDWHLHLRDGDLLEAVVSHRSLYFYEHALSKQTDAYPTLLVMVLMYIIPTWKNRYLLVFIEWVNCVVNIMISI